jgi:hypothetical protein
MNNPEYATQVFHYEFLVAQNLVRATLREPRPFDAQTLDFFFKDCEHQVENGMWKQVTCPSPNWGAFLKQTADALTLAGNRAAAGVMQSELQEFMGWFGQYYLALPAANVELHA